MQSDTASISSIGLLVLCGLALAAFWGGARLLAFLAGPARDNGDAHDRLSQGAKVAWGVMATFAALFVAVGLLMATFSARQETVVREVRVQQMREVAEALHQHAELERTRTHSSPEKGRTSTIEPEIPVGLAEAPVGSPPVAGYSDKLAAAESVAPDWTKVESIVIREGQIPVVRLVGKSRECATPAEALTEAQAVSIAALKRRLVNQYPQIGSWDMPLSVFMQHAQRTTYTHTRLRNFGSFQDPMYQAFVQFEDSPEVRERIVEEWKNATVDHRVVALVCVMAASILGLGAISAGLRAISTASSNRHKVVATAAGLATAAGIIALFFS